MSDLVPTTLSLLVVEDDAGDARIIRDLLAQAAGVRFQVAFVDRVAAAKRWLAEQHADAVLLDLGLPDAQGLQAVAEIHAAQPAVPLVVLTGLSDEEMAVRALREGAQDYLVKGQVDAALVARVVRYSIERLRTESALRHNERRYRDLVESSRVLICEHDLEGRVLLVNRPAAEALGYSPDEIVGRHLSEFLAPKGREFFPPYLDRLKERGAASGILRVLTKSGIERFWFCHVSVYYEPGRLPYAVGYAQDITEQQEREQRFREDSLRDPLTGCYNRRFLDDFEAHAKPGAAWGCLVIDVDHFKQYNDTHGHQAGDQILIRMSRFLARVGRADEPVVRLGGDEFLVLLDGADEGATAAAARRLREEGPRNAPASFSVGTAARQGDEPLRVTLDRADRHMLEVRVLERSGSFRRLTSDRD